MWRKALDIIPKIALFPIAVVLIVPIVLGGFLLGSFSSIPGGDDDS